MSYKVQCDLCPNLDGTKPNGDIPSGWGVVSLGVSSREAESAAGVGGDTSGIIEDKLHICPTCYAAAIAIGQDNLMEQLKESLRMILNPAG